MCIFVLSVYGSKFRLCFLYFRSNLHFPRSGITIRLEISRLSANISLSRILFKIFCSFFIDFKTILLIFMIRIPELEKYLRERAPTPQQEGPNTVNCQTLPDTVKHCQTMSNTARHCQTLPDTAKRNARHCQQRGTPDTVNAQGECQT